MVGHYLKGVGEETLDISADQRKGMVILMEEISNLQSYKHETLYSAVAIADHYLANLVSRNEISPCLVQLGVTCLWIASKLEEPRECRIACLIQYIANRYNVLLVVKDVRD